MAGNAQLVRDINNMYTLLAAAHYTYTTYISNLATLYSRVMGGRMNRDEVAQAQAQINNIFTRLAQYNKYFGANVNKFNKQTGPQIITQLQATPTTKAQALAVDLTKLADAFDESGYHDLADQVDEFLKNAAPDRVDQLAQEVKDLRDLVFALVARTNRMEAVQQRRSELVANITKLADFSDEIGAYVLADELDKIAEEVVEPIQQPEQGSLSTRYCPDHNGVQAVRISERVYQCPIDGKVYNYETGYTNYKGQQVPGGSIAAQTPTTSDFGGIPMRIYDSRQSVLNRVN